jgi:hypothetical protein
MWNRAPIGVGLLLAIAAMLVGTPANAMSVTVTVNGVVSSNTISTGPLAAVNPGDAAQLVLQVDSTVFMNSGSFPTRGYAINPSTFSLSLDGTVVGLQNPFPAGQTPYFAIRNNDPVVDGFFIATSVDFPTGVPLDQAGTFGQLQNDWIATYDGATLSSLDILDALGMYDTTGTTSFSWGIDDDSFTPLVIDYRSLKIAPEPAGGVLVWMALAVVGRFIAPARRRQRPR